MSGERLFGPLVVIESPSHVHAPAWWSGWRLGAWVERTLNRYYAKQCLRDSLMRGEHPYLPIEQVAALDSTTERELRARMRTALAWGSRGEVRAYYLDRGLCPQMRASLRELLERDARHIEFRTLWPRSGWVPTDAELLALTSARVPP